LVPRSARDPVDELGDFDSLTLQSGVQSRQPRAAALRRLRDRVVAFACARSIGLAIIASSLIVGGIVFATWFRTGEFYARADVGPFVRDSLRSELASTWTHQASGAGGPTFIAGRVFEIVAVDLAHAVGGTDALAQRLLYASILAFAASGGAALASRFTRRPWLVAIAGILAAFNPLVMVNLPNFLVPVFIGLVWWFFAFTLDAATQADVPSYRRFAAVSLAAAYLSANPPLLAVLLLTILILPVVAAALTGTGRSGALRGLRYLGLSAAWSIPLALWWALPFLISIKSLSSTDSVGATTNVFAWSWTHANGTLDRVLTLTSNWSWPEKTFGSKGAAVGGPSWLWLSFALPIGLVAAPLIAAEAKRRVALWLIVLACGIAFIAKGLNAPFAGVDGLGYRYVPGMWLLREPMNKVGGLLALVAIVGWLLAVDGMLTLPRPGLRAAHDARYRRFAAAVLLIAPLAFVWPMFAGTVAQSGDRVAVPGAWHSVARMVNDAPGSGKVLVLPIDDFYQVPTTWGFYGSDILPSQLFTRPTIAPNPQSYVKASENFDALVHEVETDLVLGHGSSVSNALRVLGVSEIVLRKDIDYASPIRRVKMAKPAPIAAGLASVATVRRVGRTSVADVYRTTDPNPRVEALSGAIAAPGNDAQRLASLVATTPDDFTLVTDGARSAVAEGRSWNLDANMSALLQAPSAGAWSYERRVADAPLTKLASDPNGIRLSDPVAVRVGTRDLASRSDVVVSGPGPGVAAEIDGDVFDLTPGAFLRVRNGAHVRAFGAGKSVPVDGWSPVRDCNAYSSLSIQQAGLSADEVATEAGDAVRLRARRHTACVNAPIDTAPDSLLRVSLETRAVSGAPPRVCLWLTDRRACAETVWTSNERGVWTLLSSVVRIPKDAGRVSMYLYTDEPHTRGNAGSEIWYRAVAVQPLVAGPDTVVKIPSVVSGTMQLPAERVPVATTLSVPAPSLGRFSPAANCARTDDRSLRDLGIHAQTLKSTSGPSVRLEAGNDAACVTLPVNRAYRDVTYEVEFDAAVERGTTVPRVCVWEDLARRCAPFALIGSSQGSRGTFRYRGRLASPDAKLYLYADAPRDAAVITYRNVRMRPAVDESLVIQPAASRARAPRLSIHPTGSDRFRVHVDGASNAFILALSETYSSGWKISGLPAGATAHHFEADGYRNAWAIDARGDFDVTLAYSPARIARFGRMVSMFVAIVLIGTALMGAATSRRYRRWRARRTRVRQAGPRRIAIPDGWDTLS
jgi:arabinofuranan 3-O-arabinosyltransferase